MVEYVGQTKSDGTREVLVIGPRGDQTLSPRDDLKSFAIGFDWGRTGPGASQLAIALLAHAVGDAEALSFHEGFAFHFVSALPTRWAKSADDIRAAAKWIREERAL